MTHASLKQGDLRIWNPGVQEIVNHPVKVVGLAANGVPFLGPTYIVELLVPIPDYPYTHAVAFKRDLK